MNRHIIGRTATALAAAMMLAACTTTTEEGAVGVQRSQLILVSSAEMETPKGNVNHDPKQAERVRGIAKRLIPQTTVFRKDALDWKWEVNVINSQEVNAWCMPGGKIAVYTGLIEKLQPSDDELAAVIGHEMGHALREHSREQASQQMAEQAALGIVGAIANVPDIAVQLAPMVFDLTVNLPHSRTDESEADRIGVELAARAGYDPRQAVSLWQKMQKVGGGQPPKLLATHPPTADRIKEIQATSEKVLPLYEQAKASGSATAGR
jgi:predicted Zn-dependent protease